MSKQQFNSFNKSSPYISNIDLANGAANHFNNTPLTISNELHTAGEQNNIRINIKDLTINYRGNGIQCLVSYLLRKPFDCSY